MSDERSEKCARRSHYHESLAAVIGACVLKRPCGTNGSFSSSHDMKKGRTYTGQQRVR
jgi:hypothetical protein